jgi:hypothetical protein
MKDRLVFGSLSIFFGFWASLLGALWNLVNLEDELPRCSVGFGCAESLLQDYWTVYVASTVVVVIGVIAIVLGTWLVLTRNRGSEVKRESA